MALPVKTVIGIQTSEQEDDIMIDNSNVIDINLHTWVGLSLDKSMVDRTSHKAAILGDCE